MPHLDVVDARPLRFDDGSPVRAASGIAPFGDGWLIVQDDAIDGVWWRAERIRRIRLLPAVDGLEVFSQADGTKHLKPDLEAACAVEVEGAPAVLLLGSGSLHTRMRGVLATLEGETPRATAADLSPVYAAVVAALEMDPADLNLEGACVLGDRLRWFTRGNHKSGVPSASVDVDLAGMLDSVRGRCATDQVALANPCRYTLGTMDGVELAITDAVALVGGELLVSLAAEDTPNPIDDGTVVGSALAVLEETRVRSIAPLPRGPDGASPKVEGLALLSETPGEATVLAVTDVDDPRVPSTALTLRLHVA